MKNTRKKIIMTAIIVMAIIMSIIPAFAADGQSYHFVIHDENVLATLVDPIEVNIIDDRQYLIVKYDTTTYVLYFYQSNTQNGSWTDTTSTQIYQMQLPRYFHVTIEYTRGNTDFLFSMGYNAETIYIINTINDTSIENTWLEVELINDNSAYQEGVDEVVNNPGRYNLYTQTQYTNYGNAQYVNGRNQVINNPQQYQLHSNDEYLAYGQQEYNRGVTNGGIEYEKTSKTLIGIANVGVTGIFNVMVQFLNSTSIFGVTIMSIIVSILIIFTIYMIFKIVKG